MLDWIVTSIFSRGYNEYGEIVTTIEPWMYLLV